MLWLQLALSKYRTEHKDKKDLCVTVILLFFYYHYFRLLSLVSSAPSPH